MDPNIARLIAPEPSLNATMVQGRKVIQFYTRVGLTGGRLFACPTTDGTPSQAGMVPEFSQPSDGDNSMIDTSQQLSQMNIPENEALFLAFTFNETHPQFAGVESFRPVAACVKELNNPDPVSGLTGLLALYPPGSNEDQAFKTFIARSPALVEALRLEMKT